MSDFLTGIKVTLPIDTLREELKSKNLIGFNPTVINRMMQDVIQHCEYELNSIDTANLGREEIKRKQQEIFQKELAEWKFEPSRIVGPEKWVESERSDTRSQNTYYPNSVEMKESKCDILSNGANSKIGTYSITKNRITYAQNSDVVIEDKYSVGMDKEESMGRKELKALDFEGTGHALTGEEVVTRREGEQYIQVITRKIDGQDEKAEIRKGQLKPGQKNLPKAEYYPRENETSDREM